MSRIFSFGQVCTVLLLVLVACSSADRRGWTGAEDDGSNEAMIVGYHCTEPESLVVRYTQDQASLWIDEAWLVLPRLISASGERYSDGETVFWGKGKEAWFVHPGLADQTCTFAEVPSQWAEAEGRGVAVRAIGQEPGWLLEIHVGGGADFSYDYGTGHVGFDQTVSSSQTDALIYKARTSGHSLVARITPGPCLDSMSGEYMTHHVEVTFDNKPYKGCGRILKS